MAGWTPEEDARLHALAREGNSATQISAELRRSRNSVIGRAHRIGAALQGTVPMAVPMDADLLRYLKDCAHACETTPNEVARLILREVMTDDLALERAA